MVDEYITGIAKNDSNIYDAEVYKTENMQMVYDEDYYNGNAIKTTIPNIPIFDTGELPIGNYTGQYSISFFYTSNTATTQGAPLLRIEMYEDGVLMSEDTSIYDNGTIYEYDLNFFEHSLDYGLHIQKTLKPKSTYQIIVRTSESLSNDVIFDHITFTKIPENVGADGFPIQQSISRRNSGSTTDISASGTKLTFEIVFGVIYGTWAANDNNTMGFTYNSKFKKVLGAFGTMYSEADGKLTVDWDSVNYTSSQVIMNIKNNSSSSCTLAGDVANLRIFVVGYI